MGRSMIDATSDGALMVKTPATIRHLIANMVENSQQFGSRLITRTKEFGQIPYVDSQKIEHRLDEMISLIR